ncbi:MAG: hypothetical protein JO316_15655 [Abitibacteriaceae bacterium]|nr:hypothetical protein [Abditibacteriaceae bacterium]
MLPYSQKDIQDTIQILQGRTGLTVRYSSAGGFSFHNPADGKRVAPPIQQRDAFDLLEQTHLRNNPPPPLPPPNPYNAPTPGGSSGGTDTSSPTYIPPVLPSGNGNSGGRNNSGGGNGGASRTGLFNQIFRGRNDTRFLERGIASIFSDDDVAIAAATGAVTGTVFNVRNAGRVGEQAATTLLTGFKTGVTGFTAPMREAAGNLISAFLEPFGGSGQATQRLTERVGSAVSGIFDTAFEGIGGLLKTGSKLVGTGVGLAGAGGGALIGGVIAGPAGILSGAVIGSTIGVLVSKALGAVTDLFGGILGTIGKFAGEVGGVVAEGLRSAIDILKDDFTSLLRQAKSALDLSQQSGLSLATSQNAIVEGMAFGIPADKIPHQNSYLQGMMSRSIYGGSGDNSAEDIAAFRQWYRQRSAGGGVNLLMAQNMAGVVGKENYIGAAMMPDALFNRQQTTSQALQSAFNLRPDEIAAAGQALQGTLNLLGEFAELLKTRLAADALPYINHALEFTIGLLKEHSSQIAEMLKTGVTTGFDYLERFAKFMYADFPFVMAEAAKSVLHFLAIVAEATPVLFKTLKEDAKNVASTVKGAVHTATTVGHAVDWVRRLGGGGDTPDTTVNADMGGGSLDILKGVGKLAVGAWVARQLGGAALRGVGNLLTGGAGGYGLGLRIGTGLRTVAPLLTNPLVAIPALTVGLGYGAAWMKFRHDMQPWDIAQAQTAEYQSKLSHMSSDQRRALLFHLGPSQHPSNPILDYLGMPTPAYKQGQNPFLDYIKAAYNTVDAKERSLGSIAERERNFDNALLHDIAHNTKRAADSLERRQRSSGGDLRTKARFSDYVAEDMLDDILR